MSYLVLARKWRPRSFDTLIGQDHVVRALIHALSSGRLHHAWLFTGTRGVGKTTLSRILAKSLNCADGVTATPCGHCQACTEIDAGRFVDYIELDAASNRGVDEMTQLLEQAVYAPSSGRYKVYMIDEVHMLTGHAFNAMLKTLEEPPPHVKFILATTDPQKIPVTVLSRCLQFNLKQMTVPAITGHLQYILQQEAIPADVPALRLIAQAAAGSMRDALSLTDQAISYAAGNLTAAAISDMLGTLDQEHLAALLRALAQADAQAVVAVADDLSARGLSFQAALADLAILLSRVAIAQRLGHAQADDPQADVITELAGLLSPDDLQLFYAVAVHSRQELSLAPDEYAGFVMACLRMLALLPPDRLPPVRLDPARAAGPAPAEPANTVGAGPVAALPPAAPPAAESAAPAPAAAPAEARAPGDAATPAEVPLGQAGMAPEPPIQGSGVQEPPAWEDPPPAAIPAASPSASPSLPAVDQSAAPPSGPRLAHPAGGSADRTSEPCPDASPTAVSPAVSMTVSTATPAPAAVDAPRAEAAVLPAASADPIPVSQPVTRPADGDASGADWTAQVPDVEDVQDAQAALDADWTTQLADLPDHFGQAADPDDVLLDDGLPLASLPDLPGADLPVKLPGLPKSGAGAEAAPAVPDPATLTSADWPAVAQALPVTGAARALALNSEWLSGDDHQIRLQVAIHTLTEGGALDRLRTGLTEHFGRVLRLDVQYGHTGGDTAYAVDQAAQARRQRAAEDAAAQDPLVQALTAQFDARLVPGSVRPPAV